MTQAQSIVKKFVDMADQAGVTALIISLTDEDGQLTSAAFSNGSGYDIDKAIVGASQSISELAKAKLASQGFTEAN